MKRQMLLAFLLVISLTACGKTQEEVQTLTETEAVDTAETPAAELAAETEEVSESTEETEAESESSEYTILMAGDMLLHDRVEAVSKNEDGSYDYDAIFANVKDEIEGADLAIANQEVIIGGEELGISGYPAFNAPYEFADDLVEAGFDVVCHGTNHALDKGEQGIRNCLAYWDTNYSQIGVLGIHDSAEDQEEIYIKEITGGKKLAILNYTFGTNGIELPNDMPYGVDYLNEERVVSDLQRAEEEADFTIVCPHWGTEYSLEEDSSQAKWTKIFVANGADLIIGTHPHVIEPVEYYTDEESGNTALVFYSIGNFVNWTSGEGAGVSNRMVGGLAEVTLEISDTVEIEDYQAVPIVSHVISAEDGVTVYRLSDYTEELAAENEINSQVDDFSLEYCQNLVDEIWN